MQLANNLYCSTTGSYFWFQDWIFFLVPSWNIQQSTDQPEKSPLDSSASDDLYSNTDYSSLATREGSYPYSRNIRLGTSSVSDTDTIDLAKAIAAA